MLNKVHTTVISRAQTALIARVYTIKPMTYSRSTHYVNKPLIYIISIASHVAPPKGENRSRGYSVGDLISGAKLIDRVEQAVFRLAGGIVYSWQCGIIRAGVAVVRRSRRHPSLFVVQSSGVTNENRLIQERSADTVPCYDAPAWQYKQFHCANH